MAENRILYLSNEVFMLYVFFFFIAANVGDFESFHSKAVPRALFWITRAIAIPECGFPVFDTAIAWKLEFRWRWC